MGDPDQFEPSDVLAVQALSVKVPPESTARLVIAEAEWFSSLLRRLPNEVDLWEADRVMLNLSASGTPIHRCFECPTMKLADSCQAGTAR